MSAPPISSSLPPQPPHSQQAMPLPSLMPKRANATGSVLPLLERVTVGPAEQDVSWIKVMKFALSLLFCQFKAWVEGSIYVWNNLITGQITLGGLPLMSNVDGIAEENDVIISLTEEFELRTKTWTATPVTPEEWKKRGKVFWHFPAPDFEPVPIQTLLEVAMAMDLAVQANKKVYVHCKAGVGRSAMATICYLIFCQKYPADDAIDYVRDRRRSTNLNKKQIDQIYEFAKRHGKPGAGERRFQEEQSSERPRLELEPDNDSLGLSAFSTSPFLSF